MFREEPHGKLTIGSHVRLHPLSNAGIGEGGEYQYPGRIRYVVFTS